MSLDEAHASRPPEGPRYAVYLTPHPNDALSVRAAQWLGRSPWEGETVERPNRIDMPAGVLDRVTAAPRHYGFHATLRAPFEPSAAFDEEAFVDAVMRFSALQKPLELKLSVRFLSVFMALLADDQSAIARLGDALLEVCEPFRAPLSPYDRKRRLKGPLSDRQIENLAAFGYPYVGQDFMFHMTLSGPVEAEKQAALLRAGKRWFADLLAKPVRFEGLAIVHQPDRNTPFRALRFAPFDAG
ncbi:MAG: DUF1045 domain-containing protein [Pseudomonadota bacterium]